MQLVEKYHVELPICETVYHVLYENQDPVCALNDLLSRSQKGEFL